MAKLARQRRRFHGASDVRGFDGIPGGFMLPVGLMLGGLGLILLRGSTMSTISSGVSSLLGSAFDFAKAAAFKAALPAPLPNWSTQILVAAQRYGVDPWVLAGIMWRESNGGASLTPKNDPGGTGDFIPRGPSGVSLPSGWQASKYASYANPATGLPPDGKGWGRGLMQIDYGVHNSWVINSQWWDPQVNIDKGASILADNLAYYRRASTGTIAIEQWRINTGMPAYGIKPWSQLKPGTVFPATARDPRPLSGQTLYEAAIAAYNAGLSGPLQAIAVGLSPEVVTSHQDYVSWFTTRIASWKGNFK